MTRGICRLSEGKLIGISETKDIVKSEYGASVDNKLIDGDSLVSMNFWCYPVEFMDVLKKGFQVFLKSMKDSLKDEYLLPIIADEMLKTGVDFSVLPTDDKWFGVTYKEDKPMVVNSIRELIEAGEYKNMVSGTKTEK